MQLDRSEDMKSLIQGYSEETVFRDQPYDHETLKQDVQKHLKQKTGDCQFKAGNKLDEKTFPSSATKGKCKGKGRGKGPASWRDVFIPPLKAMLEARFVQVHARH